MRLFVIATSLMIVAFGSSAGCAEPLVPATFQQPRAPLPPKATAETTPPPAADDDSPHTDAAPQQAAAPTPPQAPIEPPPAGRAPPAPAIAPALGPYFSGTDAQEAFWERRWADAATAYDRWVAENADAPEAARARLLAAISHLYAGKPQKAARALSDLVGKLGPLDDYVRLLAAEAWLRSNAPTRAIEQLDALAADDEDEDEGSHEDFAQARRISLLRARALAAAGKARPAAEAFKAHLADYPSAAPTVLLEAAEAMGDLGPAARPDVARALRAVMARAPHTDASRTADRRLKALPRTLRRMTVDELSVRLEAQSKGQYHRQALATARQIQRRARVGSDAWCAAGYREARTLEKQKSWADAVPVFDRLSKQCDEASPALYVDILYYGAKRHMRSGQARTAFVWFTRIQKAAPEHTYVDDTLLWQAQIRRDQRRNRSADGLLLKAIEANGDMQEQAAWRLFWHHYEAGNLRRALEVAEMAVEKVAPALQLKSRGRLLYWLGRTLERRRKRVRAAVSYARSVREYPLSYYSQLALQRLRSLDPQAAQDAERAAQMVAEATPILKSSAALLEKPRVVRAIELLRLGLRAFARAELDRLDTRAGVRERDWLLALLYDRVGDHTRSYHIARWRRPEYARSFPAQGHEERWRLAHPRPEAFGPTVRRAARTHGLDEALVWAVMRTESGFKAEAVSIANAVGLMQLILSTGKAMARREGVVGRVDRQRLQDPDLNIRLGARYLGRLAARFEGHPALVAAGYNAGPGGPLKWLRRRPGQELDQFVENIPYRETRRYVKSVLTAWLRYRHLYGAGDPPRVALRLPRVE